MQLLGIIGYTIGLRRFLYFTQADKQGGLSHFGWWCCAKPVFTCSNLMYCAWAVFNVKCFVNKDNRVYTCLVHFNLTINPWSFISRTHFPLENLIAVFQPQTSVYNVTAHNNARSLYFHKLLNPSQYFFGNYLFSKTWGKRLFVQTLPFHTCQNKTIIDC